MKKWLLGLLVVPLSLGVLAGCGSKEDDTAASKGSDDGKEKTEKVETIKIGYMPNFSSVGLPVIAKEAGYFEEVGLKPELVEFADGPTIVAAMESGSIDVGNIGPGAHVLLPQGKAQVVTLDQLGNADYVLGSKEKGVKTIQDLKGKKIAVATGTSSELILRLTLEEAGLKDSDVTLVDMDAAAITTAMLSGKIDACATWSPNTHTIINQMKDDIVELSNNARYVDKIPTISSWAIKPGYYEENKDKTLKFEKAIMKAMDYRKNDGKEMAKWVAKQLAVDEKNVEEQLQDGEYFDAKGLLEIAKDGTMLKYYEKQQENFVDKGMLKDVKELTPAKDYLLTQVIEEANK